MQQIGALIFGLLCLFWALWERYGKPETRSWVTSSSVITDSVNPSPIFRDERFVLLTLPSLSLFLLGLGCLQLSVLPGGNLALFLFVVCVLLIVIGFVGLISGLITAIPYPKWIRPRWLKTYYIKNKK